MSRDHAPNHKSRLRHLLTLEATYRILFEHSWDAMYISTEEGQTLDLNPAAQRLLGYTVEDLETLHARDVYVDLSQRDRLQAEIRTHGVATDHEVRLRRKNGVLLDCLISATADLGADGSTLLYQGRIRDITRQKREEKRRSLLMEAGTLLTDPDDYTDTLNSVAQLMVE